MLMTTPPRQRPPLPRRALVLGLATLLAACTPNNAVRSSASAGTAPPGSASTSTDSSIAHGGGTIAASTEPVWEEVPLAFPDAPVAAARVWTGEEVLLLGGRVAAERPAPASTGGAAYRPATRTWRPIARGAPDGIAGAAWTGAVVLVLAADPDPAARGRAFVYDPSADRWRRIADPPPPRASGFDGLIWTGTEVVAPRLLAAWNPQSGLWRPIADLPPEAIGRPFQAFHDNGSVHFVAHGRELVYHPSSDTWDARRTDSMFGSGRFARVGDDVAVLDLDLPPNSTTWSLQAAIITDGTWTGIARPPNQAVRCSIGSTTWGDAALFHVCAGYALLDREHRWTAIEPAPSAPRYGGQVIVAGRELYMFLDAETEDAANGQPARRASMHHLRGAAALVGDEVDPPAPSTAIPPDTAPAASSWTLGSVTFDLPAGYLVLEPPKPAGAGTTMTIELPAYPPWPPEPPCTMSVGDVGPGGRTFADLATIALPPSSYAPRQLTIPTGVVDDGHHVVVELRAGEVLDISCDKAFNPTALLDALR